MNDLDAVGFGALNVDLLTRVRGLKLGGEHAVVEETVTPGGSAANTIYALAKLRLRTAFMGVVGGDEHGQTLLESFREVGTSTTWIRIDQHQRTGVAQCYTDRRERQIFLYSNANKGYQRREMEQALTELVPRTRLLHVTSFVDPEQLDLQLTLAKSLQGDVILSCTPGGLYVAIGLAKIDPLLQRANYLFFNADEITQLTASAPDRYKSAARTLLGRYRNCRAVVVTLGRGKKTNGNGKLLEHQEPLRVGSQEMLPGRVTSIAFGQGGQEIPVYLNGGSADVTDPIGAGDAYAAGFLCGVLENRPLPDCARLGHCMSQISISGRGARQALPDRSSLEDCVIQDKAQESTAAFALG